MIDAGPASALSASCVALVTGRWTTLTSLKERVGEASEACAALRLLVPPSGNSVCQESVVSTAVYAQLLVRILGSLLIGCLGGFIVGRRPPLAPARFFAEPLRVVPPAPASRKRGAARASTVTGRGFLG